MTKLQMEIGVLGGLRQGAAIGRLTLGEPPRILQHVAELNADVGAQWGDLERGALGAGRLGIAPGVAQAVPVSDMRLAGRRRRLAPAAGRIGLAHQPIGARLSGTGKQTAHPARPAISRRAMVGPTTQIREGDARSSPAPNRSGSGPRENRSNSRCRKRSGLPNFRLSVGLPLGATMLTLRADRKKLLSLKGRLPDGKGVARFGIPV